MKDDHALSPSPYVLVRNDIVVDVNQSFLDLTGYAPEDLLNIRFSALSDLLKSDFKYTNDSNEFFIFTRSKKFKLVNINIQDYPMLNERVYTFNDKPDFSLENKFPVEHKLLCADISGVAIFSARDFRILNANSTFCGFFGEPYNEKAECIGHTLYELMPDWTNTPSYNIWNNIVKTNEIYYEKENIYEYYKRGITYWDVTLIPIDENGEVKYIIEIDNDVTQPVLDRKKIEEQARDLYERKEQLEAILENMSDIFVVLNRDGRSYKLNKRIKDLNYIKNESSFREINYNDTKYYDMNGKTLTFEELPAARALRGEKISNFRLTIETDGKRKHSSVNAVPMYNQNGEITHAVSFGRDITDIVEHEKHLIKQHDILYKIIDTFDLPIARFSFPDFHIIDFNKKAYKEISEYSSCNIAELNSIRGRHINDIFPEFMEPANLKRIYEMEHSKNTVHFKNCRALKKGEECYLNLVMQPLTNMNNEIIEVLVATMDVTSEIRKNKELEKILKFQEEFFAYITHEFKTPLTVIYSAIQAMELLCRNEFSERTKGFINKIRHSSLQQLRLVNNLLDITRAESGYLKVNRRNFDIVDMTMSIVNSVAPFAEKKKINLIFSSSEEDKTIMIDDEKYERILLNLLSNAIKFTPEGKSIRVMLSFGNNRICIKVMDEGIGIPKDKHKIIFERFGQVNSGLTRTSEGTGLGLCLVKILVNVLEGEIELESVEGQGTTFTIYIPVIEKTNNESIKNIGDSLEDRLVQSLNIEFSNIYSE